MSKFAESPTSLVLLSGLSVGLLAMIYSLFSMPDDAGMAALIIPWFLFIFGLIVGLILGFVLKVYVKGSRRRPWVMAFSGISLASFIFLVYAFFNF